MSSSETGDLRGLVDVLVERNTKLMATIDELRTDFSELKEKCDALVASTTAQRQRDAQWHQDTAAKLESLAGRRRLSSAVSTQRRGLSSETCGDPSGPALLVEGVCSCTEGLLVEGRNVTKELDKFFAASSTTATAVASTTTTTSTTTASTVTANSSCALILQHYPAATDGIYMVDGDALGAPPQHVWCDMTGGGWTLLLSVATGSAHFSSFSAKTPQVPTSSGGAAAPNDGVWAPLPNATVTGHVNLTAFDLHNGNRTVKATCTHSTKKLVYSFQSSLLRAWDGGVYNTVGATGTTEDPVGWMVLSTADVGYYGIGYHFICGGSPNSISSGIFGIGMCSGQGSYHKWTSHRVSFSSWVAGLGVANGIYIGCDGQSSDSAFPGSGAAFQFWVK